MTFNIPDMTCKHCVKKIEKALLLNGLKAKVDLPNQRVSFIDEKDADRIREAVTKAGYTVSP